MGWLPSRVRDPRLYALWVVLLAALVLLPGLGSYGLWEPHEVRIADRAAELARAADEAEADNKDEAAKTPRRHPELTPELAAWGMRHLGGKEGGARLPLAGLALVVVLCGFFIGFRVGGPRAGLIAGLLLIASPAVLLQGRHLTSDIGSAAGAAMVGLGLAGLLSGRGFGFFRRHVVHDVLDAILIAVGTYLGYRAAGALVGVIPTFAGFGLGATALLLARPRPEGADARLRHAVVAGLALAAAVAALSYFVGEAFDWVDAAKGDSGILVDLFGKTFKPEHGHLDVIAGSWRSNGDVRVGLTSVLEQIAVGTFPWVGLIPIAVGTALFARRPSAAIDGEAPAAPTRRDAGATALALWALAAYVATTVASRKVGGTMFPAWAALAAAAGVWVDGALARRSEDSEGLPVMALFILATAVVVGRDLVGFAERITSFNLPGTKLDYPEGVKAHLGWIVLGWLAAFALALALAARRPEAPRSGDPRWRRIVDRGWAWIWRGGPAAAAVFTAATALYMTQVLTPTLSSKLSPKDILVTYQQLRQEGEPLGIMGRAPGAAYYAKTEFEELRGRTALLQFLQRPGRVFALTPRGELCPFNKAAGPKNVEYHVVDDSSAQYRLLSNRLRPGETDHNPLLGIFLDGPPADIGTPLHFNLDDQLELIGVSMPKEVRRGSKFTMRLYFKVLAPVHRNWKKIFVHFDSGIRFQADHEPAQGICGTAYWVPGDVVVDEFQVTAGSRTHPLRTYKVWVGLYVGSAPNYTNMTVKSPGADENNRIPVGSIRLR